MEKIYEMKFVFPGLPHVVVYPDRVQYDNGIGYMKIERNILTSKITSVSTKGISSRVFIKTNDGKTYRLKTIGLKKRDELKDAILSTLK